MLTKIHSAQGKNTRWNSATEAWQFLFYCQFILLLGESGISPRVLLKITLHQLHSDQSISTQIFVLSLSYGLLSTTDLTHPKSCCQGMSYVTVVYDAINHWKYHRPSCCSSVSAKKSSSEDDAALRKLENEDSKELEEPEIEDSDKFKVDLTVQSSDSPMVDEVAAETDTDKSLPQLTQEQINLDQFSLSKVWIVFNTFSVAYSISKTRVNWTEVHRATEATGGCCSVQCCAASCSVCPALWMSVGSCSSLYKTAWNGNMDNLNFHYCCSSYSPVLWVYDRMHFILMVL